MYRITFLVKNTPNVLHHHLITIHSYVYQVEDAEVNLD